MPENSADSLSPKEYSVSAAIDRRWPVLGRGFSRKGWCACAAELDTLCIGVGERDPWDALGTFAKSIPDDGGIVGYLSYEAAGWLDPSLRLPHGDAALPVLHATKFSQLISLVDGGREKIGGSFAPPDQVSLGVSSELYAEYIKATQDAIRRGDIFQANISQKFDALWRTARPDLSTVFQELIAARPARYAAFLPLGDKHAILSNSPELFLEIENGKVTAEPIKGTRPRRLTETADREIAESLVSDPKERAENIMIADLLRNDLAKICADHTIKEEEICALRSLSYVHHLYSRITGELREEESAITALAACFPCGSITGAPKRRSMEIIAGIEGEGRGPYCGAIFLLKPNGDAVISVPIRTALLAFDEEKTTLSARFGGGITIRSEPQAEYKETLTKASAFGALFS